MGGDLFVLGFGQCWEFGALEFVDVEETENVLVFSALVLLNFLVFFIVLLVLAYHLMRLLISQANLQQIHLNKQEQSKQYPRNYTHQHNPRNSQ